MTPELIAHLESLVQKKGRLEVSHGSSELGLPYTATLGGNWPYCAGATLVGALETLVREHLRIEREELQKRLNAIDESLNL